MKFDAVDIEFIHLGIKNGGSFDERDIAGSHLERLGSGRVLDVLGSLIERGLVTNADGSFCITDAAKEMLWDDKAPLETRILRLLRAKAYGSEQISEYLCVPHEHISDRLESLRKAGLVLMTQMKTGERLLKLYEILPDGIERLEDKSGISEIPYMLDRVSDIIEGSDIKEKQEALDALKTIKERLATLGAGGPVSGQV